MRWKLTFILLFIAALAGHAWADHDAPAPRKPVSDKTLLIGLIPERNIFEQLERYEPLADYLSKKTGIDVRLRVLTRYENIINNFKDMHLDGAFFGSFTYALAHVKLGVEPLARPEGVDGVSTYYGLVFLRKDSNIRSVADMKGKVFAFVDKATTAGHLLPLAFFRENGIKDYRTFFRETYFAGTHEDVIYDVLHRRADIGAAKNTVFYEYAKKDRNVIEELIVLKKSPEVPSNGLAVRQDLDPSIKIRLKDVLLGMDGDPDGTNVLKHMNLRRFVETTDYDYRSVYHYITDVELDLAAYDYMNE